MQVGVALLGGVGQMVPEVKGQGLAAGIDQGPLAQGRGGVQVPGQLRPQDQDGQLPHPPLLQEFPQEEGGGQAPAEARAIGQPLGDEIAVEGLHRKGVDGGVPPGQVPPGRLFQVIPG